jgi:hypothetical protein
MEKTILHESTHVNINPAERSLYDREFPMPNGDRFVLRNYVHAGQMAAELHYLYGNAWAGNKYVVNVIPSEWLNDAEYMAKMENEYLVKIVHQLDMGDHS